MFLTFFYFFFLERFYIYDVTVTLRICYKQSNGRRTAVEHRSRLVVATTALGWFYVDSRVMMEFTKRHCTSSVHQDDVVLHCMG